MASEFQTLIFCGMAVITAPFAVEGAKQLITPEAICSIDQATIQKVFREEIVPKAGKDAGTAYMLEDVTLGILGGPDCESQIADALEAFQAQGAPTEFAMEEGN